MCTTAMRMSCRDAAEAVDAVGRVHRKNATPVRVLDVPDWG